MAQSSSLFHAQALAGNSENQTLYWMSDGGSNSQVFQFDVSANHFAMHTHHDLGTVVDMDIDPSSGSLIFVSGDSRVYRTGRCVP